MILYKIKVFFFTAEQLLYLHLIGEGSVWKLLVKNVKCKCLISHEFPSFKILNWYNVKNMAMRKCLHGVRTNSWLYLKLFSLVLSNPGID